MNGGRALLAFPAVAVVSAGLLLPFHDRHWYPPDEGSYAHVAERILDGEVLHRDVQDVHLGAINYANALSMRLFGRRLVSMRYIPAFLALVQALIVTGLVLPAGLYPAAVAGIGSVTGGFLLFLDPSANWYALFHSILLVAWLSWAPRGRSRLVVAGALLGLVALFRQLTGAIVGIGVVTWLLVERHERGEETAVPAGRLTYALWAGGFLALVSYVLLAGRAGALILFGVWPLLVHLLAVTQLRRSSRDSLALLGWLGLGIAVAVIPVLAYQVALAGPAPWWEDVVVRAFRVADYASTLERGWGSLFLAFLLGALVTPLPGPLISTAVVILILAPASLGVVVLARWRKGVPFTGLGPATFLAVYYGLVPMHFPSLVYLCFALPLVLAGLLATVRSPALPAGLAVVLGMMVWSFAGQPSWGRTVSQILEGQREPWVRMPTVERAGLEVSPSEAEAWSRIVGRVKRETAPGDAIFAFPSHAELYFLSERRNPTRFFNTALGIQGIDELDRLIAAFTREPPEAIVFDPGRHYATAESDSLLRWVRRHYTPADSALNLVLYLRARRSP